MDRIHPNRFDTFCYSVDRAHSEDFNGSDTSVLTSDFTFFTDRAHLIGFGERKISRLTPSFDSSSITCVRMVSVNRISNNSLLAFPFRGVGSRILISHD
jgi:hypothetical protein